VLGYWGQPPEMENNQYPFLCVPGYLKSDIGDGMYDFKVLLLLDILYIEARVKKPFHSNSS